MPSQLHTSLISRPGSIDVKFFPDFGSHIFTILLSALMMRRVPSAPVWYFTSMIGEPYMWSFSATGRLERRSNSLTTPSESPHANCIPLGSNFTAVTPSPWPGRPGAETFKTPTRARDRGSKHSAVPSSVPAANKPCVSETPQQLRFSALASIGARNRPCSRLSLYTSDELPTIARSPVEAT